MSLDDGSQTTLELHCDDIAVKVFQQLLQRGVALQIQVGFSVRDVLCRQLGIDSEYVDKRINTIFLNSMPVDDVDEAIVSDQTVLALSASMPGLAGAVLRKGGFFAGLRSSISYSGAKVVSGQGRGELILKLYNMTALEIGPHILEHGVLVGADELREFFSERVQRFWDGCSQALINGQPESIEKLRSLDWPEKADKIALRVTQGA